LPALQQPLGNQRLVQWILEICALPPVLPSGVDEVDDPSL